MSIFSNVSARRPQSTDFNLSHTRKFGFAPGFAIPTLCQEVLPSEKWHYNMSALIRFMPMQAPVMHMVDVYNYSFFIPARLTMERSKFETFITGGNRGDGKDALGNTIEIPYLVVNFLDDGTSSAVSFNDNVLFGSDDNVVGNLADFLGLQSGTRISDAVRTLRVNMMPFIAFWRVWNQYFRDQNLHPDFEELYPGIFESHGDITAAIWAAYNAAAPNTLDFFNLPKVCWEKDYFTSALPFAQRGNPVEAPLTGSATVTYKTPGEQIVDSDGDPIAVGGTVQIVPSAGDGGFLRNLTGDPTGELSVENIDEVTLESGGFTINQLRLAARLQEWLEKMARGGARYIEQIKAHFGVISSDARLQRPEFLGGGKIPVNISEVLQTSEDSVDESGTPLATMAGHGVAAGNVNSFHRFFEEHGFIISIMFLRPRTAYQQGIPRLWTQRFDKLNWAWPSFAHLGEQEILNMELYFRNNGDPVVGDLGTFGYQARYAEYKYIPSTVHGEFKGNLNFWHWGRIFAAAPALNKAFVEADPSVRIFNVVDDNVSKMYCIVNNRIHARRPLPYFSSPAL